MRRTLFLLAALAGSAGCNPVTGPSGCHWETKPEVRYEEATRVEGRLVFVIVYAPKTRTRVCAAGAE